MKRLTLIPLLLICAIAFGQMYNEKDSIRVPNGADTTVYKRFYSDTPWGISFDYSDFDDVDAILDIGDCPVNDGTVFNAWAHDSLPYTMSSSTVSFKSASFNFSYLAIKLTKNSVTAGLYVKYWITRNTAFSLREAEESRHPKGILARQYIGDAWDRKFLIYKS